jgi:hypothetical protein
MRMIEQLRINIDMEQLYKNLQSYQFIRRGNYQFKVSIYKQNQCLIVGNHIFDPDKFFIRSFEDLELAALYIEYIITKDYQDGGY